MMSSIPASASASASIEVESKDVLRLILQYLKENNLHESFHKLQIESSITLNTVDNIDTFINDIKNGKWDLVLKQVNNLTLQKEKLINLYEQIILELVVINNERELSKDILRNTSCMLSLKDDDPERYYKLEHYCVKTTINSIEMNDIVNTKDRKRYDIATSIKNDIATAPKGRLLTLLNQSLLYQKSNGLLSTSNHQIDGMDGSSCISYDLFLGDSRSQRKDSDDAMVTRQSGYIKFNTHSHPETFLFSYDDVSLVTGSIDGFIEVWDYQSCKLRNDLVYQSTDEYMMHENVPVIACTVSHDYHMLCTGDQKGEMKLWKIATGTCIRRYATAHSAGITSLSFSKENNQILSSSFDTLARIHGIKSGKLLKEFRGHTSYVNTCTYVSSSAATTNSDGNVLTGSSDGTIKLWDKQSCECVLTYRPGYEVGKVLKEITINSIQAMPNNNEHIFVCTKSHQCYIVTLTGQLVRSFSSGRVEGCDFVCGVVSPRGRYLYCASEDGNVYVFDVNEGKLESILNVISSSSGSNGEIIGIIHHPYRSLLATIVDDGTLKIWKP